MGRTNGPVTTKRYRKSLRVPASRERALDEIAIIQLIFYILLRRTSDYQRSHDWINGERKLSAKQSLADDCRRGELLVSGRHA
jgi:hypothetical protein